MKTINKLFFYFSYLLMHQKRVIQILGQRISAKKIHQIKKINKNPRVSIIIVTYNALEYVKICLNSISKASYSNKEIVVVDNNSNEETKNYLRVLKRQSQIDRLYLSKTNTYFSGGNNIGARLSDKNSKYIILLNSDTEIKDPRWIEILLSLAPEEGIISFGKVDFPVLRPDGWCFMINRNLYLQNGGINEYYKMNWGLTELTARILTKGFPVYSIINPDKYVHHFGKKSSGKKNTIHFNNMTHCEILKLYGNNFTKLYNLSLIK